MSVKSRVTSNRGFTRGKIPSVIETYRNTFQSLMQRRGGFVMVDPSVRRPYPFGDVWAEYCRKFGVAADESWLDEVRKYEKDVLAKRG